MIFFWALNDLCPDGESILPYSDDFNRKVFVFARLLTLMPQAMLVLFTDPTVWRIDPMYGIGAVMSARS